MRPIARTGVGWTGVAWAIVAASGLLVGACFNAPGGAVLFSCSEDAPDCPAGYTCKPDGCCHDEDESEAEYETSQDRCSLAPPPTTGVTSTGDSSTSGSSTAGTADGTATSTDASSTAATSSASSDGGATSSTTDASGSSSSSSGSSGSSDSGTSSGTAS